MQLPEIQKLLIDNFKRDLRETGCDDWKWIELAQEHVQWLALAITLLNLWVLLQ
jgi:hypothetical protein